MRRARNSAAVICTGTRPPEGGRESVASSIVSAMDDAWTSPTLSGAKLSSRSLTQYRDDPNLIEARDLRAALAKGHLNAPFVYRIQMETDTLSHSFVSPCTLVLGVEQILLTVRAAVEVYDHDVSLNGRNYADTNRQVRSGDQDARPKLEALTEPARLALHSVLCRDLFDADLSPDWYLEALTGPQLTAETAMRALEIRHARQEIQTLRESVNVSKEAAESSNRSARIATWVAGISAVGALVGAGVQWWAVGQVQDVRPTGPVQLQARP